MDRGLAAATGMGFVGFIARQNHWWQTPKVPQTLRAVAGHLTRGQDIMLFGRSMGSAGALLAARSLPVSTVLTVAPPIIVDEQHAPWERRFQSVAHLARQIHGLEPNADRRMRTYVTYDPFDRDDVNHLQLPDAAGQTYVRWPVPFSDHTPMVDVWKAGLYRDLPPHSSSGATCRPHGGSCAGRARRGMVQLHCLQRRSFPRARLLQPGYSTGLYALIECHGDQPEKLLERGRALMRQDRHDLALLDFQTLQQFEDRRLFRNLVEQAQMAMAART